MKYFIDCGTNHGQGLQEFNQKLNFFNNPEWVIHTIEPNPGINPDFSNNNSERILAVINRDDESKLTMFDFKMSNNNILEFLHTSL